MKAELLSQGVAVARVVVAIRDAEKEGASGVTYAWLAQHLDIHRKGLKRSVHRAAKAGFVLIAVESPGRGQKAKLSLTAEGRACAE